MPVSEAFFALLVLQGIAIHSMLAIRNSYPDIGESIQQIHDARGVAYAASISED